MKMNNLFLKSVFLFTGSIVLSAGNFEYPEIYKDPKIMGMGGVSVGLGGGFSSVFTNPAGLSKIKKDYGWEVDLLNLSLAYDDKIIDFIDELDKASNVGDLDNDGNSDNDQTKATNKILEKYAGDNMHVDLNLLISMSKKFDESAFGIGAIGGGNINYTAHQGFGSDGFLEVNSLLFGGIVVGASKDYSNVNFKNFELNNFSLGIGGKFLKYTSLKHNFSVNELNEYSDDLMDYADKSGFLKEGSSIAFDVGAQYEIVKDLYGGLSILNIGGVGDSSTVEIPMTVNLGVGYIKRFEDRVMFNQLKVGLDYIDLFYGYEQDEDFTKRTRVGAEFYVWDGWLSTGVVKAGLYQGNPTFGIDLRLSVVNISYATYSQEVGAYGGQKTDKRHIANISVGW